MSRIANSPVEVPAGVEVKLEAQDISVKGGKGSMALAIHQNVEVKQEENVLKFSAKDSSKKSVALAGTTRALVSNMVFGVNTGFERKLVLNGVGYRTKVSGNTLNLVLGFSHDVNYELPEGVKKLELSVRQSLIKVKVFATLMNMFVVKKRRKNK